MNLLARLLGSGVKEWEREHVERGETKKTGSKTVSMSGSVTGSDENERKTGNKIAGETDDGGKLQRALRAIARANGDVAEEAEKAAVKAAAYKKGRHVPSASVAEMDGAVTSAIAELGAISAVQTAEVTNAARARLKGKAVDSKILNERVRARLA